MFMIMYMAVMFAVASAQQKSQSFVSGLWVPKWAEKSMQDVSPNGNGGKTQDTKKKKRSPWLAIEFLLVS